jgi:tetratricopeptide (TPR) repeat protein/TolB-like protein
MGDRRRRSAAAFACGLAGLLVAAVLAPGPPAAAQAKPRVVLIVPFDAGAVAADERWIGEGLAQVIRLALAQHPALVQIDQARLRAVGPIDGSSEAAVLQAARTVRADTALYGAVRRGESELSIRPRLMDVKSGDSIALEPIAVADGELLARMPVLVTAYLKTMKVPVSDAEAARIDKAARLTKSQRAFELFARSQSAHRRGGQEGNEMAADLLSRAIEADPSFVVAQYTLGTVHQALGNRWKAAAQFRASTQLDPTYPEPYKALGDLFLAAPRRLFDQAVDAYSKAIELRPFYADAHVGLGDAKAAKGDIDGAVVAYQKALSYNAVNPRVHMSLGKIYYNEKGLYYESVSAFKRAIDLDPASVEARMGLGEVYEDKGLYKEAIEEYRKVIDLDSKHTGAMYNLAIVYEKVDPREAIAQWERYIALASQLPSEKDWVDVARQHLRKLRNQVKD